MAPNRYELDLSNEVLIIHFGQGAVKISEVKVGGCKKNLPAQPNPGCGGLESGRVDDFFFDLQL